MKNLVKSRVVIYFVLSLLTIASLAGAVYFYLQYQKAQLTLTNPTLAAQQAASQTIASVGKLMELPTNETPQIATVSDVSKLAGQPFFANAKNGDKVLIYQKAKVAILYDPIANKIVAVAPVNSNTVTPTPTVTPVATKKVKATPTPIPTSEK